MIQIDLEKKCSITGVVDIRMFVSLPVLLISVHSNVPLCPPPPDILANFIYLSFSSLVSLSRFFLSYQQYFFVFFSSFLPLSPFPFSSLPQIVLHITDMDCCQTRRRPRSSQVMWARMRTVTLSWTEMTSDPQPLTQDPSHSYSLHHSSYLYTLLTKVTR